MQKNELARLALQELSNVGIDATLADLENVDDNVPLVMAMMGSGLMAPGMRGLVLTGSDLSHADMDVLIRASRGMHQGDSWIRGDLMNYIRESEYAGGDIPKQDMDSFARQFGCSPKRLQNNMTTCAAWDVNDRYDSALLTHTHHEVLTPLVGEQRSEWAERCISETLSVTRLRELLAEEAGALNLSATVLPATNGVTPTVHVFDNTYALNTMWDWYINECKKVDEKMAFGNMFQTFLSNGLVTLPQAKWEAALARSVAKNGGSK
jgi:hypothetical protein